MPKAKKLLIPILGIAFLLVVSGCGTAQNNDESDTANNTTAADTQTQDSQSELSKYDGKVYQIKSADGKVEGQLGFKLEDFDGDPVLATGYLIMINDDLPLRQTSAGFEEYSYAAHLTNSESDPRLADDGEIGAVVCNKDQRVNIMDAIDDSSITDMYFDCKTMFEPTSTFYLLFTRYNTAEAFDIDTILAQNKLYLFDTADYWVETEDGGMGVDHEVALESAPIAREYDIEITE